MVKDYIQQKKDRNAYADFVVVQPGNFNLRYATLQENLQFEYLDLSNVPVYVVVFVIHIALRSLLFLLMAKLLVSKKHCKIFCHSNYRYSPVYRFIYINC